MLRGFGDEGFRFFTNRTSLKGRQLADNPRAQLLFFWRELGRQILIHGNVDQLSDEESDAYFESRARESRIGAWASEQGSVIESREQLLAQVEEAGARFEGEDVPRPPHWGGYIVSPQAIEFWQAGEFRLHDRFVYRRNDGGLWVAERLSPIKTRTATTPVARPRPNRNRRFLLAERPSGPVDDKTFNLVTEDVPTIADGEALVRVKWISIDPTNRMWIGAEPTYLPPVGIGEEMRALGLGEVVESKSDDYPVGAIVTGLTGWQDYMVTSAAMPLMTVPAGIPVEPQTLLGTLGMTGCTAYFGMLEIGDPQEGETVVISAAAGAVGSVAGQLAKQRGARVVGIAGGPEKCAWLKDELGFDEAVDYKADDWRAQLKAATPNGIDVDFENVGGEIMEAVFSRLNMNARVAALRPDLRLQRHRAGARPAHLRQPAGAARNTEGLHHPRLLRPLPRSA